MAQLPSKMLGLSSSKLTGDGALEQYLELTKKCMERAQTMTLPSVSTSPKFNFEQCKYLADKLKLAVESADAFLVLLKKGHFWVTSAEDTAICLEIFKLLYVLSKEVESFIQDCCKDAWIQAALMLSNVSEHISSIGFYLEFWTFFFSESKKLRAIRSLILTEVESIFKAEVEIVKEKATLDMEMLSRNVNALCHPRNSTSTEYQLAAFVLDRLDKSRLIPAGNLPGSSQLSLSQTVASSVQEMELLGKGSAASVYRGIWLGAKIALKMFDGPDNPDFNQEMSVLRGLSHPNIISLFYSTTDEHNCSIVMELMDTDLHSLMRARRLKGRGGSPFDILEGVDIMLQIGRGMRYLHELKIVHRDLKSLNILVRLLKASELEIEYLLMKVADFGLSKTKERSVTYSKQTTNLGTTRWMAPEMMKASNTENQAERSDGEAMVAKYPFKCDIYSFAMVCYEILTGYMPFLNISRQSDVKQLVLKGDRPNLPEACPNQLKGLIKRCWSPDAWKRPSFGYICKELRHLKCLLLMPSLAMAISDDFFGDYLKQTMSSIDLVQKLLKDQQVQLNPLQCDYLFKKLTETGSFLRAKGDSLVSIRDSADIRRKALLQLHFAVKRAEKLVQGCCCQSESWLESAVTLAHVKEDIVDILLDLQWWRSMVHIAIVLFQTSSGQEIVLEILRCAEEDCENLLNKLQVSNNGLHLAASKDVDLLLGKLRNVETSYAGINRTAEQNHDYLLAIHVRSRLENSEVETTEELNSYDDSEMVGLGDFGTVMNVRWMGRRCALKMLRQKCKKEASSLSELQHPHIVKFIRYWEAPYIGTSQGTPRSDSSVQSHLALNSHILMEVLPMDLAQHLQTLKVGNVVNSTKRKPDHLRGLSVPQEVAIDVMVQMVKAMWYLNNNDVAHRDLKPTNVLVRPVRENEVPELRHRGYLCAKIADFGLAKVTALSLADDLDSEPFNMGSKVYRAPEVFNKNTISSKKFPQEADVWSFGIICCEILSGMPPFPGLEDGTMTLGELVKKVKDGFRPRLPENCPDYLKFIITSCWELRPQDRPKFSDLLRLVRLAQVRNLGLIQKNHDLFVYKTRDSVKSLHPLKKSPTPAPLIQSQAPPKPSFLHSFSSLNLRNSVAFLTGSTSQTANHSSDCKPYGYLVNQVWPPCDSPDPSTSNSSKVDVIFFEGNVAQMIHMSCKETWVQRGERNVQWPRDWLPKDLGGDIRVLLLEYSISDDGVEGVLDHLQRLLVFRDLWNRGHTWERPILLVGHSLGCVLIEHLVVALDKRAKSIQNLEDEIEISRAKVSQAFLASLAGCFFYAPPWTGLVPSEDLLKHVFGGLSFSGKLFSDLCSNSRNPKVLSEDFMRARSEHMKLMAVIEGFHTRGRTVVPPASMQDFAGTAVELADSNHTDVCKPINKQHPAYTELLGFVRDILENSRAIQYPSDDKQPAGMSSDKRPA